MPEPQKEQYDFSGFDEAFATLGPEEREKANQRILEYLELVLFIAQQQESLTPIKYPRTLALSGQRQDLTITN